MNSLGLVISYLIFSFFHFYQLKHIKNFQGASQIFRLILSLFGFLCMIFMYAFLIYLGYKTIWYYPIILFIGGITIKFIYSFIESKFQIKDYQFIFSLSGFVIIPITIFFMLRYFPK